MYRNTIGIHNCLSCVQNCVTSREVQEKNLNHVKRGRSCEAESNSPFSRRMPSAASDDGGSKCDPVARKLV